MPLSRPSCGETNATRRPSRTISPSSAWNTPEIALISVDLPAPLSPAKATTSPGKTSRETLFNAWTPPKCLETLRTPRIGASSLNLPSSQKTTLRLIDEHRNNDHGADRDELPER